MFDWIANQFAALHDQVFETGVLPVMHALGFGGYAEQAFDWTEFFLIGAIVSRCWRFCLARWRSGGRLKFRSRMPTKKSMFCTP